MTEGQPVSDYSKIAAAEAARQNRALSSRRERDPRSSNRPPRVLPLTVEVQNSDPLAMAVEGIGLHLRRQIGQDVDEQVLVEGLQVLADLPAKDYKEATRSLKEE